VFENWAYEVGFWVYDAFFYYRNKWKNSRPDNFGLNKRVGLITMGLTSRDYCIKYIGSNYCTV